MKSPLVPALAFACSTLMTAAPLTLTVPPPAAPTVAIFNMGAATNPAGTSLALDTRSLLRDGRAWLPVMGEFHFTRYPESEWREELLKMKAGGIDIVATYVFWIHHEETENKFDWAGRKNLRRFVELAREAGLLVAVRCGPWCHGEVRNGGVPDWAIAKGWKLRSDDAPYLAHVKLLYGEIAQQVRGLLWKDGGPVVAVQVENEFRGPAEHLLALKRIARDAGLDVPLYTRTGWPALSTPMPFGEIAPLFGAYAEGFWDRELTSMPGKYWAAFHFNAVRTDAAIATEQLGQREAQDETDAHRYPYLTCELGGGMVSSYHRRIAIDPADVETVALVKVGAGGNLPGYYMYHGGTNPVSPRGTPLMEAQDTPMTNWNDMPSRGYDFFAPLGEYGQLRPHYHALRRLHLLARDFGEQLAPLPPAFPDMRPEGRPDFDTLRWSVRSDGRSGFVFVSNHERAAEMPAKDGVQFAIKLTAETLTFPAKPVTVPAGARFLWPFNLALGHGVTLAHATAQPVCAIDDGAVRTVFFAATPGIAAEFAVSAGGKAPKLHALKPSREVGLTVKGDDGSVQLVLLDEADSLALWKGECFGRERVVLSRNGVVFDGGKLRLSAENGDLPAAGIFPAPKEVLAGATPTAVAKDGVFTRVSAPAALTTALAVNADPVRAAGPAREIPFGKIKTPVAAAPLDADFAAAAVWKLTLPAGWEKKDLLLRLHYRGDVARVLLGGKLVTDDFFNGRPFEFGLARHAAELAAGAELTVAILPLRADAPIYLPADVWPKTADGEPVAALDRVEVVERRTVEFSAGK